MDDTTHLKLPYILAAQSQKHVTHNEALRALDAIVQLAVLDNDLATPPGSPAEGARYIVAGSPTGAWAGQAGRIAAFQDGAWAFFAPNEGWLAWVADEDTLYVFDGSSWVLNPVGAGVNPVGLVGVNATADTTNRLAVASPASLFNHAGSGHQLKLNKATSGDTGAVLFQTGFSGRAEFGLTGDDNFHVKVSANGSAWNEALVAERSTGVVAFPHGVTLAGGAQALDFYEVGTFTPELKFQTLGDLSVSYAQQFGHYCRIGKLVYAFLRFTATPTYTTASGNVQITGLPFAVGSALLQGGGVSDHLAALTYPSSRTFPVARFAGSTTLGLVAFGPGLGSANLTTANVPSGQEQRFVVQIIYLV